VEQEIHRAQPRHAIDELDATKALSFRCFF
jgi:hypothetical protein